MEENGLEFFEIRDDKSELMAFMVKNLGLTPSMKSLNDGDVGLFAKRGYGIAYGTRTIYGAIKKRLGASTLSYILAAHFPQGFEEARASTEEEARTC